MGNHNDPDLGPAGKTDTQRATETISPGPAPTGPKAGSATSVLGDVAKAIAPSISKIMGGIETFEKAWDLVKPHTPQISMGDGKPFPQAISKLNEINLSRAYRYAMAKVFLDELMRIGREVAGIDFSTWKNGAPPEPTAAPDQGGGVVDTIAKILHLGDSAPSTPTAPAAPVAPAAPAVAAPGATPTAPTPPVIAAAPGFGKAQALVDFVSNATLDDLKDRAKAGVLEKITTKNIHDIPRWYWNGSNQNGFGDPPKEGEFSKMDFPKPYDPDADGRTFVEIYWHLSVAKLSETLMMGMPAEVTHFSPVSSQHQQVHDLGWYTGGYCQTFNTEAHGDNVSASIKQNEYQDGINAPVGGHHMSFEFMWDRSNTEMHCDISFDPRSMTELLPDVKVGSKEPKT